MLLFVRGTISNYLELVSSSVAWIHILYIIITGLEPIIAIDGAKDFPVVFNLDRECELELGLEQGEAADIRNFLIPDPVPEPNAAPEPNPASEPASEPNPAPEPIDNGNLSPFDPDEIFISSSDDDQVDDVVLEVKVGGLLIIKKCVSEQETRYTDSSTPSCSSQGDMEHKKVEMQVKKEKGEDITVKIKIEKNPASAQADDCSTSSAVSIESGELTD